MQAMKITSGILAVAAASGALLAATAPAHATDVLNPVNAKRIPVSILSEGSTSADNIQITGVDQTGVGSDGGSTEEYHHVSGCSDSRLWLRTSSTRTRSTTARTTAS